MALNLDRQNQYRNQYRTRKPGWRPATEVYEGLIREHLRPQMRVLDIGCGRGGVLEQISAGVGFPVGIDPDLLSLREHRLPDLSRAEATADHLPFCSQSFDLILASWVMEHLDRPEVALSEISRCLAPGGYLIFLTPNGRSVVAWLNRVLRPLQAYLVPRLYGRSETDTFPVRYRVNNAAQLRRLAARTGLELDRLMFVEDPTYLAFSAFWFRVSLWLTRISPPVHLVGALYREIP